MEHWRSTLVTKPITEKEFEDHLSFLRGEVNKGLRRLPLDETPAYLYDPVRYVLNGKGKRLRPILLHLVGQVFDADPQDLLVAGLAVELLHNFTLVHDDIMDDDDIRHGQATVHSKWDASTAILAGDGIYAIGQLMISQVSRRQLDAIRAFNQATLMVCEGQAFDKEFEHNSDITLDQYFMMVQKKTGWLLGLCAELGGILGDQNGELLERLRSYGLNLGKTFQIQDDILEIFAHKETMGKSLGSDILSGKQTVLTILARTNKPMEWVSLNRRLRQRNLNDSLPEYRSFFELTGIKSKAEEMAATFANQARADLEIIPVEKRKSLERFTNYVLNRKK